MFFFVCCFLFLLLAFCAAVGVLILPLETMDIRFYGGVLYVSALSSLEGGVGGCFFSMCLLAHVGAAATAEAGETGAAAIARGQPAVTHPNPVCLPLFVSLSFSWLSGVRGCCSLWVERDLSLFREEDSRHPSIQQLHLSVEP